MDELNRLQIAKEAENPFYLNDPYLLDIYHKCFPPRESYYYFPKGEEIYTYNSKKPIKTIRRIFFNTQYFDYENKLLKELKEIINSHTELKIPDYFKDYFILMFVYARGGDLNASYKLLVEYVNFCNRLFPFNITPNCKVIEILNKGFIYVYGRDNRFRPIIVCQSKVFQKYEKEYQFEELLQATSFMCQFIVNKILLPGQFETWNMIVNLKGVSIISLPDSLKKLIPALSNYFLCRLNKNYLIGLNFITRILYKIAVNFIDPITATKIIVIESKKDPKLFQNIRPDNIEEQFGGTAPNMPVDKENGYFPPRMPSPYFIKDEENKNDILISEEDYIQKYKKGEIPVETVSPYIHEELKQKEKSETKISSNETNDYNNKAQITQTNISNEDNIILQSKTEIIQNKINIENNKIIIAKNSEMNKIKKFVNYNWHHDNETLSNNTISYNSESIKNVNIINDINKFGIKKQNFTRKLFSIND